MKRPHLPKLSDLRIRTRLAAGFGGVLVLLALVAGVAIFEIGLLGSVSRALATDAKAVHVSLETRALITHNGLRAVAVPRAGGEERAALVKDFANDREQVNQNLKRLEGYLTTEPQKLSFGELQSARAAFIRSAEEVFALVADGKRASADMVVAEKMMPALDRVVASSQALGDVIQIGLLERVEEASARETQTLLVVAVLAAVAILGGIFLAWSLGRSITRPLGVAVEVSRRVSQGDLSYAVDSVAKDEIGELQHSQSEMVKALAQIVGEVRSGTEHVSSASTEIAQGNQDLSARTEQQASSLEQTAASMEHLSQAVRESAESAREASRLAENASGVARRGGEVVHEVVETMHGISDASRKIGEIIGVIDGIAFHAASRSWPPRCGPSRAAAPRPLARSSPSSGPRARRSPRARVSSRTPAGPWTRSSRASGA